MYKRKEKNLIFWSQELHRQGLVTGFSGNISCRYGNDRIMITGHDTHLGYLRPEDIVMVDLAGNADSGNRFPSSEVKLHLALYRQYTKKVVVHAHPPFTTLFFNTYKRIVPVSFEAACVSHCPVIPQDTPTVTCLAPVVAAFKKSDIVILKHHGVIAIGDDFRSAFSLIELLENQAKLNIVLKSFS